MRVPITKPTTLEDLKSKIEQHFPDMKCEFRGKKIIVVSQPGSSAAALVLLRSNKVIVNEGFATMGSTMVFSFSIVLLGIIIPFIIYYVTFFPKQKAIRDKVVGFIGNELN